jgi:hypothetical protein
MIRLEALRDCNYCLPLVTNFRGVVVSQQGSMLFYHVKLSLFILTYLTKLLIVLGES